MSADSPAFSFVVSRNVLFETLSLLRGGVESRSGLPILSHILIDAADNGLRLTCSNLETEITASLPAEVAGPFRATAGAGKLHDIARHAPEGAKLTFSLQGERLTVRYGKTRFALQSLRPDEFPRAEVQSDSQAWSMPGQTLYRLLGFVEHAVAAQDVRYYLNGALLEADGQALRAVASDGFRLALNEAGSSLTFPPDARPIIPRHAVVLFNRLIGANEQDVRLSLSSRSVRLEMGAVCITARLIDGKFPNYQPLVPAKTSTVARVKRASLQEALRRAAICADGAKTPVALVLGEGILSITVSGQNGEEFTETLPIDYTGVSFRIGFNVKFLLESLDAVGADTVQLGFNNSDAGAVVQGVDATTPFVVLMPVRLPPLGASVPETEEDRVENETAAAAA